MATFSNLTRSLLASPASMSRRQFFTRLGMLGLATGSLAAMSTGCGATQISAKGTINWYCESVQHDSFKNLVQLFHKFNPDITVNLHPLPAYSNSQNPPYNKILNNLNANADNRPDVVSLDVTWIRKFVSEKRIVPLDEWHPQAGQYLSTPLNLVTIDGKIWAAPLHTDVGMLFYRADLPAITNYIKKYRKDAGQWTWQDISAMASQAMQSGLTPYGFLWQGTDEPLVCNFVEFLSSFNASVLSPDNKVVLVNSPQAQAALRQVIDWIYKEQISPVSVTKNNEADSANHWVKGEAAFMRNWPGLVFWSEDARSTEIAGKYKVTHLPAGEFNGQYYPAKSCLGGWQLAITQVSQYPDAAWQFIRWMLDRDAQRYLAVREAFPVTFQSVYSDPQITGPNPYLREVPPIVKKAQPRPTVPYYQDISDKIQLHIHQALTNPATYPPEKALAELERDLKQIVARNSNQIK